MNGKDLLEKLQQIPPEDLPKYILQKEFWVFNSHESDFQEKRDVNDIYIDTSTKEIIFD